MFEIFDKFTTDHIARTLSVDVPDDYRDQAALALAEAIAATPCHTATFDADFVGDGIGEAADNLVPIYTTDRFALAAVWSESWQLSDTGLYPDGADLVYLLGVHLWDAFYNALHEARPYYHEVRDFAEDIGLGTTELDALDALLDTGLEFVFVDALNIAAALASVPAAVKETALVFMSDGMHPQDALRAAGALVLAA